MVRKGEYLEFATDLQNERKLKENEDNDYSTELCIILELIELVKTLEVKVEALKKEVNG